MEQITPSPQLLAKVKRLKEGEIRIFRLLHAGTIDISTKKPIKCGSFTTTGEFVIYDKFEKEPAKMRKVLKNVTASHTVVKNGEHVLEEVVEDITFSAGRGICIVNHTEYPKLVCLTLASENASNIFRDKKVRPIWEEVQPDKDLAKKNEELDYEFHAQVLVREAVNDSKLRELAKKTGVFAEDKTSEQLLYDLKLKAKKEPKEILRAGGDTKIRTQIYIDDALFLGIIEFFEDTREWKYIEKNEVICKVDQGQFEDDRLVEYLVSTPKANTELITTINKIYKQAA
jgi:predicted regulator of amino acid metabolism with ACT domain